VTIRELLRAVIVVTSVNTQNPCPGILSAIGIFRQWQARSGVSRWSAENHADFSQTDAGPFPSQPRIGTSLPRL